MLDILVADDQPENLVAMEAMLGGLGHNLILVNSGWEALRQILRREPALVLLDVRMPVMGGFETARLIRERERSRAIPIIFLTGATANSDMVFKGYSSGAVDYLVKPINPDILRAKVKIFLDLPIVRRELEVENTRRRRAEEKLKIHSERLRLAVEGADLGTWHLNLITQSLIWSEKARSLFRIPDDRELTQESFLNRIHPDDRAKVKDALQKAIEDDTDLKVIYRTRLPNGTTRWISSRGCPYYDRDGSPVRVEGVVFDITEQMEAEEKVRNVNAALTDRAADLVVINQELENFALSASHDLRAPLRHLHGFAQLLTNSLKGALNGENQLFLDKISLSAGRMSQLLDDLLMFSRLGKEDLQCGRVNLESLMDEVLRDLEMDLVGRNIQWKREVLPEVLGDSAMLRQVLVNLVSNAVKYTVHSDPAKIEISSEKIGDDIVIAIRDNGIGFNMEHASKLFKVFQRLHGREFEGTGIGLANVRRIVERHGGQTWAEGETGKGATFFFSLYMPPDEAEMYLPEPKAEAKLDASPEEKAGPPGDGGSD